MELFPAADEEQFEYIKTIIDQSDYYILISAGKYGSIHPVTGLSYTEMEYDYAEKTKKPIVRLLHKAPFETLKGAHIEASDAGKKKLKAFRDRLTQAKLVNFWEDEKELGLLVVSGLLDAMKRYPAVGWVRADGRASEDAELEIYKLREELERTQKAIPTASLAEGLAFQLPFTEATIENLDGGLDYVYLFDLLSRVERELDDPYYARERIRPNLTRSLTDVSGCRRSYEDAELLIDALLLDKVLTMSASSKMSLTVTGRQILAKARLAGVLLH